MMLGQVDIYGLVFIILLMITLPIIAFGHKYNSHHIRVLGYGSFTLFLLINLLYNTFS